MKNEVLKMIVKYLDVKGLVMELLDETLEKAIMEAVEKSETKVDDTFVPMIYPLVEAEILKQIEEKLDLEKILGLEE